MSTGTDKERKKLQEFSDRLMLFNQYLQNFRKAPKKLEEVIFTFKKA